MVTEPRAERARDPARPLRSSGLITDEAAPRTSSRTAACHVSYISLSSGTVFDRVAEVLHVLLEPGAVAGVQVPHLPVFPLLLELRLPGERLGQVRDADLLTVLLDHGARVDEQVLGVDDRRYLAGDLLGELEQLELRLEADLAQRHRGVQLVVGHQSEGGVADDERVGELLHVVLVGDVADVVRHVLEEHRLVGGGRLDHLGGALEGLGMALLGLHAHGLLVRGLEVEEVAVGLVDDLEVAALEHHAFEAGGDGARDGPKRDDLVHALLLDVW